MEIIVTHNDINLDNVVFRDGRAVALIDFDLAGPGSRAWDVACAARLWAPLRPGVYIFDTRRGREFERFRLFVDTYGMSDSDRLRVAEAVRQNYEWFYHLIQTSAAAGHAGFAKLWTCKTSVRAALTPRWTPRTNRTFALPSVSNRPLPRIATGKYGEWRVPALSRRRGVVYPGCSPDRWCWMSFVAGYRSR